ncbi:MAG: carbohydrate ABC transporter permease [Clostridia bacterium]|nr:carbohydrate ABC transporter permease [Clostridia bacterium]
MKISRDALLLPVDGLEQRKMETVDFKDVDHYEEDGVTPVFKKHLKERTILTKRTRADKILFGIVFVIFLIQSISLFIPIAWLFMSSLKMPNEFFSVQPFLGHSQSALPLFWEFENYIEIFSNPNFKFMTMLFNSLWYTLTGTALEIFLPTMTAYVLSRYKFFGRNFLYTLIVITLMIPIVGTTGAALRFFGFLRVYDTLMFPLVAGLGGGFSGIFLVYYGFFKTISESYSEAARIDGAGHFTIFFRIILPQAAPIIFTYAITQAIGRWNDYISVLTYMKSHPTLASGLYELEKEQMHSDGDYPVYFAGLFLSLLPPVILFATFSQKIMTSVSIGGLKG